MADETLRFDIIGRDNASGAFSRVAVSAKDMGDKMDVATRHALVLDEALKRQSTAARVSADATLAAAKADKLLADAERTLSDEALKADFALRRQADAAKKAGDDSARASAGVNALAGGGGIPGGGIAALVAGGVALAPILVTVGTGLAGFAAAAYGVAKPIENAAQKTGGLQKNMSLLDPEERKVAAGLLALGGQYDKFQKALKPEVLGVFGKGLQLASNLMHDVEPVARATGKALGGFLNQIDQEFASNNWQNFFKFMAQTAGPDIKLLGDAFVSLAQDLPPLLEGLQPIATALLTVVKYSGDAIRASQLASTNFSQMGVAGQQAAKGFNATTEGAKAAIPGMEYVSKLGHENGAGLDILYGNSGKAAKGTQDLTGKQKAEAAASVAQTAAMNKLNAAVTTNIAKVLTLEGDEVSWKQAQQAATTAVNQNSHALDGNSKSALAARAAIIQSTSAVIKFADDSNTSTTALFRGSAALQNQIGWLEKHAGKSKIAREEIKLLREEEAKIKREIDQRLKVTGSGSFSITGAPGHELPHHRPSGAASGMFITAGTSPTADDVLIRASKGELVVPTRMVAAGAVDHLRGRIPGFASGGIVPSYSGGVPGLGPWAVHNTQSVLASLDKAVASATAAALTSFTAGLGGPTSASASAAQRYAASILGAYGWGQSQMGPLISLWNRESGWNRLARNPSSGAYGIPQALPPGKMGAAANPPTSSASAQIQWGLGYIKTRPGYGSPAAAWAHELAYGWYDSGADYLPTGASIAINNTGRPERVGGEDLGPKLDAILGALAELIDTTAASANSTGRALGAALSNGARTATYQAMYGS